MSTLKKYSYILKGLDCANCANKIEKKVASYEEYHNVVVNFSTLKLNFESNEESSKVTKNIKDIVKKIEPDVEVLEKEEKINDKKSETKAIIRLLVGIIIAIIGFFLPLPFRLGEVLVIIAYILLLSRTAKNAYNIFKKSKSINENFLVTLSCVGAYLVGEHMEGLMVIILYEIGKILEEKAVNNTMLGSTAYVPAVAGLLITNHIINDVCKL